MSLADLPYWGHRGVASYKHSLRQPWPLLTSLILRAPCRLTNISRNSYRTAYSFLVAVEPSNLSTPCYFALRTRGDIVIVSMASIPTLSTWNCRTTASGLRYPGYILQRLMLLTNDFSIQLRSPRRPISRTPGKTELIFSASRDRESLSQIRTLIQHIPKWIQDHRTPVL